MPSSRTYVSNGWTLFGLLALYFAAHLAARVFASDALELDEAEQVLWTQQLAAGYGAQPPLYTWLQWTFFQIIGVSVPALALLKNLLLATTYTCTWLAARRLVAPPLAVLAAAGMLLIPQIGWESQRDLTHSVLVTCLASASLYVVVRLLDEGPRPALYIALGLLAGLGMLSKYSYAVFAAALALAVLLRRDARAVWLNPWLIASGAVALLVFLPHGLWLIDHWQAASARTLEKLNTGGGAVAGGPLRGLTSLAGAIAATVAGLYLILALVFGRAAFRRDASSPWPRFWRHYLIGLALFMLAMVFVGGATHFKGRWLQPLLFVAPLMFFSSRPHLADSPRLGVLRGVLVVFGLLYLSLAAGRPLLDGWRDRPDELNEPALELATALRAAGYDGHLPIVTDTPVFGGVLRLRFPDAPVTVWKAGAPAPLLPEGPRLVIGRGAAAGELLERSGVGEGTRLALPYRHVRPDLPPVEYRYVLVR